jgi:hypothetical protein
MTGQSSSRATPVQWWKPALFFLVVIVGLWYVKWQPYYGKAFTAAETHSIGKSILAQADVSPFQAALDCDGLFSCCLESRRARVLLGSLIQVLIPELADAYLGAKEADRDPWYAVFAAGHDVLLLCSAVAAGMRRQQVSMGGALAFWMGNPLLNPATLVFMGFVLGWHFVALCD